MYLQKYSYLSSNSSKNTKLGINLIRSHIIFLLDCSVCKLSYLNIYEYLWNLDKLDRIFRIKGFFIYSSANCSRIQNWYQINAETKLFISGSIWSYSSILITIIEVRENLPKRKHKKKKQGGILISQKSFTQLFNIELTKLKYSCILMKILENNRQITEKVKWYTNHRKSNGYTYMYKIIHSAAARCRKLSKLTLNWC